MATPTAVKQILAVKWISPKGELTDFKKGDLTLTGSDYVASKLPPPLYLGIGSVPPETLWHSDFYALQRLHFSSNYSQYMPCISRSKLLKAHSLFHKAQNGILHSSSFGLIVAQKSKLNCKIFDLLFKGEQFTKS